ncbi:MAG: protein translocase subunit SecD [Rhodobacteraceae bacterium]|nr:protein translocase subunit SecD [Paracoccaceae bacterium]
MLQISLWKRILIFGLCLLGIIAALPNAFYTQVEKYNDAAQAIEGGALETTEIKQALDGWIAWMPSNLVNLGLDLRGGAHLLAEVHLSDVYTDRIDAMWPDVRDALREVRAEVGTVRRTDSPVGELHVRISRPENIAQAVESVAELARPLVSLTAVGANDIEVDSEGDRVIIRLTEEEMAATDERTMQQSLEIVRRRVDEVGTREPSIQRQGRDRVIIQVPGIGSAEELKELIGQTAKLTFHPVVRRTSSGLDNPGAGNVIYPSLDEPGQFYVLERTAVVSGDQLTDAQPDFDQNGLPAVTFRFNPAGARKFGDYTAENIGAPFAIVLDGEVISAPTIQDHIPGGSGIITGRFTVEESNRLAVLLRAGALPAGMNFLEERTVGPELGQDSIDAGKVACVIAFAAVLIFMFASYGLFGLFANAALLINLVLIFGALSLIGATLTLPGIAGIVLTIGMAVDANVLVFERIREELNTAKGPARAIERGYERALTAILDANVTTLIAAVILFVMGSGPVRGFSVTLGIGIITSVFTAIFLTRLLVVIWFTWQRPKQISL